MDNVYILTYEVKHDYYFMGDNRIIVMIQDIGVLSRLSYTRNTSFFSN